MTSGTELLWGVRPATGEVSSAWFSPCRTWRYELLRRWGGGPTLNVIGLNPSTADETRNDPTVSRCIGYARRWGFGALVVTNIFALWSTDPAGLRRVPDPVGPDNDLALRRVATHSDAVLVAWGAGGALGGRAADVRDLLSGVDVRCLGTTKAGEPKHPLYLRKDALVVPYAAPSR